MALANNIRFQPGLSQEWSVERVLNSLLRLVKPDPRRAVYRQTVRELEQLSTRDLADLGISRSSIEQIARVAAYGE